jgi:hypothetical protein
MSTGSLYQEKTRVTLRTPSHPLRAEERSYQPRTFPQSLAEALDGRRFKKALFVASLVAAALYYLSVLTIALLY